MSSGSRRNPWRDDEGNASWTVDRTRRHPAWCISFGNLWRGCGSRADGHPAWCKRCRHTVLAWACLRCINVQHSSCYIKIFMNWWSLSDICLILQSHTTFVCIQPCLVSLSLYNPTSLHLSLYNFCLPVSLSLCPCTIRLSVCLSLYLSLCLSLCLSVSFPLKCTKTNV